MPETNRPPRRNMVPMVALVLASLVALIAIFFALRRGGEGHGTTNVPVANASTDPHVDANRAALAQIDTLRQAIARDPDNAGNWFRLGSLYRDFEQFPDA